MTKRFLSLLLCAAALASALPAVAQPKRADLVTRLDTCEAILQDFQSSTKTAIPTDILRRARGIIVVNQFQAGFLLGVKDGYGVVLVRRPNGRWSVPAFLSAGEISLGLQLGGKAINTVMVLMDDNTARLLFNTHMNLGAEAKAVAGIRAAEREAVSKPLPANVNVYVYTNVEGFFAGAAVKTGYFSPNEEANRVLYDTRYRLPEILYSDWIKPPPEVQELMNYVTSIAN
ncbi:MAG: lipid-binding SYLF domain-containing protein [Opitutaceae bacterium]|nr:lipid-binding SYLF domain-containing protein [Opitutaceae bacterium]